MTSVTLDQLAGVVGDFAYKAPCRAVATTNIVLSGLQTIDGVVLAALDRVLVTGQSNPQLNGIYTASVIGWNLAPDFDSPQNVERGSQVLVTDGTVYSRSVWVVTATNPVKPQDPANPSAITIATLLQPSSVIVSIKTFGAVGDGITDDTAAIRSALIGVGAGFLYVPAGTYICDNITLPSSITIVGAGKYLSSFKRKANSAQTTWWSATSKGGINLRDFGLNGNKANQTVAADNLNLSACFAVHIYGVYSLNAKGGCGIQSVDGTNQANNDNSSIVNSVFHANESHGILIQRDWVFTISGNRCSFNTGGGIEIANLTYPPPANSQNYISITDNICFSNSSGIVVTDYVVGGTTGQPVFGPAQVSSFCSVIGNKCHENNVYGIAYEGHCGSVVGNQCVRNGQGGGNGGGILFAAYSSLCEGNVTYDNSGGFGYDCGGSDSCIISGNISKYDGLTQGTAAVCFSFGATNLVLVKGNTALMVGSGYSGTGFNFAGIDGAGGVFGSFPARGQNATCEGNTVVMNSHAVSAGILITQGFSLPIIRNNTVHSDTTGRAFVLVASNLIQSGNISTSLVGIGSPIIASASGMIIPDVGEAFTISGTVTITSINTTQQQVWKDKIVDVAMTNNGSGYTMGQTYNIAFSGGGGSGAVATASLAAPGTVVGAHFTNQGTGYTSAPTCTFDAPSAGVTATGTPLITCNNQNGRTISLFFTGALTVTDGGNLNLNGDFVTTANRSVLTLRGALGQWYEVSRCVT